MDMLKQARQFKLLTDINRIYSVDITYFRYQGHGGVPLVFSGHLEYQNKYLCK